MKKLLLLSTLLFSAGVWANPITLFQCTTANDIIMNITENNGLISFSSEKQGSSELSISVPKSKVSTYPLQDLEEFDEFEGYIIEIPDEDTIHRVFYLFDKINNLAEAGVEIVHGGVSTAVISCIPDNKISNGMIDIDPAS